MHQGACDENCGDRRNGDDGRAIVEEMQPRHDVVVVGHSRGETGKSTSPTRQACRRCSTM